ncbi:MAG: 50S ribosomal protein L11 methyltransferase [Bacteroidota bacterium]|nr:50S ribosomal protein L11 methyltransferase [Bacteroidota bacterium]
MKNFIQLTINCDSIEAVEILIANLSELDFYAFEQVENTLLAFIKEEDFDEEKLKTNLPKSASYTYSIIAEKNWNQQWESDFKPINVNNFAGIRASFHELIAGVKYDVIITPKMSFGTGHHATTFLMIVLMEKIAFKDKTVLDFGTGTGVLAILSEKMGAASVLAIDCDEWSINNALENIETNQCKNIIVDKRDNILGISRVDIILANINLNVLQENAKELSALVKEGSFLIISGFLLKDESAIISTFVNNGFVKKEVVEKEGWLALLLKKL